MSLLIGDPVDRTDPAPSRSRTWSAVREIALVAVLFLAYKAGRILTSGDAGEATRHAESVWHLERLLHLPSELAVQHAMLGHHWLVLTANSYYAYVHFPATVAALIWLYLRRPALYRPTRNILAGLTATALVVHVWFPLAPPRLAPGTGLLDTGTLFGPAVYGPPDTDTLSNQYAAMPSLHVGWAVIVAVALIAATRHRLHWLWLAHPTLTLLVVVATGNHYWLDAGVALTLLAVVAAVVLRHSLRRPRVWRPALRILAGTAAVVVAVVALRGRVPNPADVLAALAGADLRWLAVAPVLQFFSQAAFARQQRALLSALDVEISRRDALAITYSRSAMSMTLPAGSAMSAAFALRQYRRRGASTAVAATVMVLSGAASVAGLTLLWAGTLGPPVLAGLAAGAAALTAVALVRRRRPATDDAACPERHARWTWADRALGQLRAIVGQARSIRARHWAATIAYAVLNWLLDLACLVVVAHACHLPVSTFHLATAYLAVQVVRQIPLTPGGVGLIEASLLTGLLSAGAPQATAAAVVLGYRVVSFWLLLPAGLLAYLRLNRAGGQPAAAV